MYDDVSTTTERGLLRAAIYTRYSDPKQKVASLEDQERNCRAFAEQNRWEVLDEYVRGDAAMSGRTMHKRQALLGLIADASSKPRPFDVFVLDESSRLGRNLSKVLDTVERLNHLGITVAFVSSKLTSKDPNFKALLAFQATMDEMSSDQTAHRVRRGQEGRARKGLSTGGRCFGYYGQRLMDPERPDAQGRGAEVGILWKVKESEAETILRICRLFVDGWSDAQICQLLNDEKVPAARKPKSGPQDAAWGVSLIKRILRNEKYNGKIVHNKTRQALNSYTGKIDTIKNPPAEWIVVDAEHLRIVPPDLWEEVQKRREHVNQRNVRHRLAGMNRAKRKDYLFSGILECGLCFSKMIIGSSSKSYACSAARTKKACTNNLWIREKSLSEQLIRGLTHNLLEPEVVDYMALSVFKELKLYLEEHNSDRCSSLSDLKERKFALHESAERIMDAIGESSAGARDQLLVRFEKLVKEQSQVERDINLHDTPQRLEKIEKDLMALIHANVSNLQTCLKQDPAKARLVLQRHIKRLVLYPVNTARGQVFSVYGEIDLFAPARDASGCVLLDRSVTETVQQHTDFLYRFLGVILETQTFEAPDTFETYLAELLHSCPKLLHTPLTAKQWADKMRPLLSERSYFYERTSHRHIAWKLEKETEFFTREFGLTAVHFGKRKWFMFSAPGSIPNVYDRIASDTVGGIAQIAHYASTSGGANNPGIFHHLLVAEAPQSKLYVDARLDHSYI